MRYLMLLTMMLASCGSIHEVSEHYRPLERVQESALRPGTAVTTIGSTVYVNDLDEWLAARPPGSPRYHALLMHEQVHARRQLDYGLKGWLGRYLIDTSFMLDEELRGWYIQLKEYQRLGVLVNPEGVAKVMAGYRNFAGPMISYEDALNWVRDVLAGRWEPED